MCPGTSSLTHHGDHVDVTGVAKGYGWTNPAVRWPSISQPTLDDPLPMDSILNSAGTGEITKRASTDIIAPVSPEAALQVPVHLQSQNADVHTSLQHATCEQKIKQLEAREERLQNENALLNSENALLIRENALLNRRMKLQMAEPGPVPQKKRRTG